LKRTYEFSAAGIVSVNEYQTRHNNPFCNSIDWADEFTFFLPTSSEVDMKRTFAFPCFLFFVVLIVVGCSRNQLIFGTATELEVVGAKSTATGEIEMNVGYDRGEIAYVPDNGGKGYSVLGAFESDIDILNGYYVNEVFATGEAAKRVVNSIDSQNGESRNKAETPPREEPIKTVDQNNGRSNNISNSISPLRPLLITTGTRFGFNSSFSWDNSVAVPFEVSLGYRRGNIAIIPIQEGEDEVRPIYADIIIGQGTLHSLLHSKCPAQPLQMRLNPNRA
jgi:hypothetical protein